MKVILTRTKLFTLIATTFFMSQHLFSGCIMYNFQGVEIFKTEDTTSIQNILDAYYDCISGPIGAVRDFDRLRSLFHPEARLIYSYWSEEDSKAKLMIFTVEEFIGKLDYLDKRGFYEHEISNRVNTFSSVTQVFSTYAFRTEDKSIEGRGITSYELFFDGDRYWIMSMFWAAEDDKYTIPDKYLIE